MGVQHTPVKEVENQGKENEVSQDCQVMASEAGKGVDVVGRETRSRSKSSLKDSSVVEAGKGVALW